MSTILETERLILRTWIDTDLASMHAINQDPQVMQHLFALQNIGSEPMHAISQDPKAIEYFLSVQDLDNTKQFIEKICNHYKKQGFSLYATVRKDNHEFIGFVGLFTADFQAPFTPAIEIGWRLSFQNWGQGFATEAAKAVLDYAFKKCTLSEVVSFTLPKNLKSRRVMEKIGLHYNPEDDFEHPRFLKRHVLYRLTQTEYFLKKK